MDPSVAAAPDGSLAFFWNGHGPDGSGFDVYGRRFDFAGAPLSGDFRVNSHTTSCQHFSSVGVDAAGRLVVAWESAFQDGGERGVFGQRFEADGTPQGSEFGVNSFTTANQRAPALAMAADGSFVVVWQSAGPLSGGHYAVFAQRFASGGSAVGPEFRVNVDTLVDQHAPAVASDADGNFVVVWQTSILSPGLGDVVARVRRFRLPADLRVPRQHVLDVVPGISGRGVRSGRELPRGLGGRGPGRHVGRVRPAVRPRGRRHGRFQGPLDHVRLASPSKRGLRRAGELRGGLAVDGQRQPCRHLRPPLPARMDLRGRLRVGNLSAWSASGTDGGDLDVSSDAALNSTPAGLRGLVDGTAALHVQDDTPDDEDRYRVRFHLDPNGFDPGEAQDRRRVRVFIAFTEAPTRRVVALVLQRLGGAYSLMGRVRLDDETRASTGFFAISDAPHLVEFDLKPASDAAAEDGSFELRIDGLTQTVLTGLDNSLAQVDLARLGALSVKTGANGTIYWDEFESWRTGLAP